MNLFRLSYNLFILKLRSFYFGFILNLEKLVLDEDSSEFFIGSENDLSIEEIDIGTTKSFFF